MITAFVEHLNFRVVPKRKKLPAVFANRDLQQGVQPCEGINIHVAHLYLGARVELFFHVQVQVVEVGYLAGPMS